MTKERKERSRGGKSTFATEINAEIALPRFSEVSCDSIFVLIHLGVCR